MAQIWRRLKGLFSSGSPEQTIEEDKAAKQELRSRYITFKRLLDANNSALKHMSILESALDSPHPFDMIFIKGELTKISTGVFSMISLLNDLSSQKYKKLEDVFSGIENSVQDILEKGLPQTGRQLVLPLQKLDRDHIHESGSKMAVLGELKNNFPQFNIPDGFSITSAAYNLFFQQSGLDTEIPRRLRTAEISDTADLHRVSSEIQMLIINADLPSELEQEILNAYKALEEVTSTGVLVSLRSSAVGEDAHGTSFAGQYKSELNVSRESILTVYKEIVAAKYSVTAMSYRRRKGIPDHLVPMCVGCMEMVEAESGGVAYSRDPLDLRQDRVIVSSAFGLPKSVVDGSLTPDRFIFTGPKLELEQSVPGHKTFRLDALPKEGIKKHELGPETAGQLSIDSHQAAEVAEAVRKLEKYFNFPVDMEWAFTRDRRLMILQARALAGMNQSEQNQAQPAEEYKESILLQGGETACHGTAAAGVYKVSSNRDMLAFPAGSILVARLALPRWASLLSSASGLITEQGSITGHLGNVAREFSVPAVFGMPGAVDALENSLEITMDADARVVYKGIIQDLLRQEESLAGIMHGTAVHKILQQVLKLVTPLSLTDPDSPDFRPSKCRTLHDLTRFCHEKGVQEMFQTGNAASFSQTGGKRLVVDVPMQWWVLDLDDGFKEKVEGKNVHISNIDSVPMLALWEGITARPWLGPPPLDGRGFMSVMVQATSNPDLSSTGPSVYANKNFFMISKYFCNLTSRMGFHFSTVETLVGDRAYENYARFSFKGGAADENRRRRRTDFIAEILSQYDFQVETHEDSLLARLRGGSDEFMLLRLKILGYLTIHTRQLDMIMLSSGKVKYYYDKIITDIQETFLKNSQQQPAKVDEDVHH
ncbi:MAG: PEP/pyruvate-binding domain-containing protein [Desulfonatronovibrionaceae bacterium]